MIENLNTVLASIRKHLEEASKHNPFRNKSTRDHTGVAASGVPHNKPKCKFKPSHSKGDSEKNDWTCKKAGSYKQVCTGPGGQKKVVKIDKAYKKAYNKKYRAYKAGQSGSKEKAKAKKALKRKQAATKNWEAPW